MIDLPTDPKEFYKTTADAELPPVADTASPALERLGQPPFPKGRFPFLGFLASVFDHVATHNKSRTPPR